jgi:hypothetical protein
MPQLSGQDFSGAGNAPTSVEIAGENRRLVCGGPMPAYVPGMSNWMPPSLRLEGEWIGKYQGHFEEVIRIDFVEGRWVATKITGDENVPAGEVTWRADAATGKGEGQIAGEGFTQPRFVPGRLEIVSPDRIVFHWRKVGRVEFRRDD